MNTHVINVRENRSQMIEKINNRIQEMGLPRYYVEPYSCTESSRYQNGYWTKAKKETITQYVYDNLVDSEYLWDDLTEEEIEQLDSEDRFPSTNDNTWLDVDDHSDFRTKLLSISIDGICRVSLLDTDCCPLSDFYVSMDSLINSKWKYVDRVLELIMKWINDPRMIKFNELVNKPNEYFEK